MLIITALLAVGFASQFNCNANEEEIMIRSTEGGSVMARTAMEKYAMFYMNGCKEDEYFGYTPIINATRSGDKKQVAELIMQGADVNWKTDFGHTPLMLACDNGNIELVAFLLEKGADPKLVGKDGSTALSLAAQNGYAEIAKLLK